MIEIFFRWDLKNFYAMYPIQLIKWKIQSYDLGDNFCLYILCDCP